MHGNKGKSRSEETKKKISRANKGRVLTDEWRKKISESHKGHKLSEETKRKISDLQRGKTPNEATRMKLRLSKLGNKSPFWKGGVSIIYQSLKEQIRRCFKYRQWRSDVFTRDGFICVICGYNKGGILEADHIVSLSGLVRKYQIKTIEEALNCEELWNINNGRTLCKVCHRKTDNWGNKNSQAS